MSRPHHLRLALLCTAFAAAPTASGQAPEKKPDARADIENGYSEIETLTRVLETVRQNYVDPEKVSYPKLMAAALRGMLAELDPHSQFMSPELFQQMNDNSAATYEGVGFTIAPESAGLAIVSVREDGPAARAGILPGDRIIKLGADPTTKLSFLECIQRLRGNPGEPLTLTTHRAPTRETRELTMIREVMRQETVRDATLLDEAATGGAKIGYLRLVQFNATSPGELADALDKLEDQGMAALVFDLRNNPGGLLNAAVEVLGEFLPPNTAVVTTEGAPGTTNPPPLRTPAKQRRARPYPLIVLVNHNSASAAELVAGALQDLGRAVIVGTTTFGKGSVQSIIPGDRGTAIRLTTARYFTPSHKMIHGVGIKPNLTATLTPEEEKKVFEAFRDRSLGKTDAAALTSLGDHQLDRALTTLAAILVYQSKPVKK
ncbi:MAG: Carboxyl-terminal protease [Verrucomicrobiales bacterium]|nr:Carboxyl-terminal protease [Verrucomicrobiales bacterium]